MYSGTRFNHVEYSPAYLEKIQRKRKERKERAHRASVFSRWRGNIPIPQGVHPLVRSLFEHMNERRATLSEVALKAGFRRGTVSEWRYRSTPRVSDLDAALNVLGLELTIRKKARK